MSEHRLIEYDRRLRVWSPLRGTAGIYGLCDPRDMRVRYVGSSNHIERRLYAHTHSTSSRGSDLPRCKWLATLVDEGVKPCAVVLEVGDFGPPQSEARHEAERRWIETYQLVGDADLNVALTPVGSAHSKDSGGKKLRAEVRRLAARVVELESELAVLRGLAACNTCNTSATLHRVAVALPVSVQRNATPPYRGCCMLHRSGPQVAERADFADTERSSV